MVPFFLFFLYLNFSMYILRFLFNDKDFFFFFLCSFPSSCSFWLEFYLGHGG